MGKILMKGNEAVCKAAILAGCKFFFGYPITPQNEIPEYMSRELPLNNGVYLQAESEVAAINMVFGAAGAGGRVMTSSSSPGIALKQEGISYITAGELPCLIVSVMRGGPGLGGIQPSQADYNQSTRGGGNGDYYFPVLAPFSIQEAVALVPLAYEIAEKYRTPVMLLYDGVLGQMMEPVTFSDIPEVEIKDKPWATDGKGNSREKNVITTLDLTAPNLEKHVKKLSKKFKEMEQKECRYEEYSCENADVIAVAYGTTARIMENVIDILKEKNINMGLIRPITLWPYPYEVIKKYRDEVSSFLVVEMSEGQMVYDVEHAVAEKCPVHFYGRSGGVVPTPEEIADYYINLIGGEK